MQRTEKPVQARSGVQVWREKSTLRSSRDARTRSIMRNFNPPGISSGRTIGIGIPEVTELGGIGERAVAIAEHDFIVGVIFARYDEIGDSILIEIRGRQVEFGSPFRQLKRPGAPERAIACAKKHDGG